MYCSNKNAATTYFFSWIYTLDDKIDIQRERWLHEMFIHLQIAL